MNDWRVLRALLATTAGVAGLVVGLLALQDLWHYGQAILADETVWVRSPQGLWMLTCGLAEVIGTTLLVCGSRTIREPEANRPLRASQSSSLEQSLGDALGSGLRRTWQGCGNGAGSPCDQPQSRVAGSTQPLKSLGDTHAKPPSLSVQSC